MLYETYPKREDPAVVKLVKKWVALLVAAATQAQQEAGTNTTAFVTPSVQQYHPSANKAGGLINQTGTQALTAGYNVSSVTDGGTGITTVNLTTAFSTANYWVTTATNSFGGGSVVEQAMVDNKTTSSFKITVHNSAGTAGDTSELNFNAGGDR